MRFYRDMKRRVITKRRLPGQFGEVIHRKQIAIWDENYEVLANTQVGLLNRRNLTARVSILGAGSRVLFACF